MQKEELDFFAQLLSDLVSSGKEAYNNWRQEKDQKLFKDWTIHAARLITGRVATQEDKIDIFKDLLAQPSFGEQDTC